MTPAVKALIDYLAELLVADHQASQPEEEPEKPPVDEAHNVCHAEDSTSKSEPDGNSQPVRAVLDR